MKKRLVRKWLSKKRALAGALLGKETGFFTQYGYMDSVSTIKQYPAVADLCLAFDGAPVFEQMRKHDDFLASDFFFDAGSRHLGSLDAAINYCVVRSLDPARVVEIGSGRSTEILARAIVDAGLDGQVTCIDPAPRLDITGLPVTFEARTLRLEDVALARSLERDDILYIDSSHILHPGTDVDIQLNVMLPALASGVVVHVHDIFLPWGYPSEWRDRHWNEVSGLIPWIASEAFEILFPSFFVTKERAADLTAAMPRFMARNTHLAPGGFWMRKI